jgi:ADP-ribose pyrophosphatase YjhB (NUDIX family)
MPIQKLSPDTLRLHKGVSYVGVSTVFFCYDEHGHFVLAKRSANARDEHGVWDPGAGGLPWGVHPEENVRREVMEEFGATVQEIEFLGYRSPLRQLHDGTPTHWLALDFACRVRHDDVRNNEPQNFDDIGWFTFDDLPQPMHSQMEPFMAQHGDKLKTILNKAQK